MSTGDTRTRAELLDEIRELRGRVTQLGRQESECQATAERLREAERRSRTWLEHSPVCTKIIDLDFNLQYMSKAGVDALQLDDVTAIYGKPYPLDFYPEVFREQMTASLTAAKQTGEVVAQEGAVLDTDGGELWFHSTIVPVPDDEGQAEYLIVVSTDITERKRSEEERVTLERQVQHAQKLESLGVLSGGIAHDFNNILMSVLGNADLALEGLSPHAPGRENIREIEKAARRAADLARQMLAYSGKGHFVIEPIGLNEFVEEMAHLLEVSISKKAVLKYNFADDLPTFEGDATQIRQILMNLITNASEAIGDRSGVIALSTGAMECDRAYLDETNEIMRAGMDEPIGLGLYVYLEVADTGCGMDGETLNKVFDPFYTTKFTGRGLGMSAVMGIIRGHRGAIKVYSEIDRGTTFKVLFPASAAPEGAPSRQGSGDPEEEAWRGHGTVLVVDDEESVCAIGRRMVEHLGFDVLTALDGREALTVYRKHGADIVCVLLDLTMPHLDGAQTFRELRRLNADVRVILSSGYNEADATQRFVGKGLAGFIQKPYSLRALEAQLRVALTE